MMDDTLSCLSLYPLSGWQMVGVLRLGVHRPLEHLRTAYNLGRGGSNIHLVLAKHTQCVELIS